MTRAGVTVIACAVLLWATSVQAVTTSAKCEVTKNQEAGKYSLCLQKAQAKLVKMKGTCSNWVGSCYRDEECPLGGTCNKDLTRYNDRIGKCLTRLTDKWAEAEAKAPFPWPPCPDLPLTVYNFEAVIKTHSQNITTALDGGGLNDCATELPQCQSDLAACLASTLPAARLLKTGQTGCWDSAGNPIPCSGTGQDGELQKGLVRSYTDNGDGTITDNQTGLMWEKKSDDGSIHDKDDVYTWANAFSVFIAALNTEPCFAGHCDWRLPNVNELQSLADHGRRRPAFDPVFNTSCAPGCTVTTCSCMQSNEYWSSTTYQDYPDYAWLVFFGYGAGGGEPKSYNLYVCAVRGGL